MLPILIATGNPIEACSAGLTWVFVQSFVLMIGRFIAPVIRRITPRAALLGSLAGISLTFIRSEEHTSELQSLILISYAVFCLNKRIIKTYLASILIDPCCL